MDNRPRPRLKINDKEVGLRDLGDGLFEPKNFTVLREVFGGYHNPKGTSGFFVKNLPPIEEPKKYHKIQSFCFVVTENIKREGAMMLKSLRKFHNQPVYIICDFASKRFLNQEGLKDDSVFCKLTDKEELKQINEKIFKNHKCIANNVHRPAEILRKMDVMEFALTHHDNTFFLDADIIILDNLQEYFSAKVVLSPHYYPKQYTAHGFENGFYNAGYVFCASKGFPKFWKHIYLNDSIFFEQECMNRIPDRQKIQTFSREHNVGFWRRGQFPKHIKSLHFHITDGVDKNRCDSLKKMNQDIKSFGVNLLKENHRDLYNYYLRMAAPKKIAFIHFGKAAGVFVNEYMKQKCVKSYDKYMSYHENLNPFKISNRDWKKDELLEIAETEKEYAYVTNHHIHWDLETIKKFKENGWFTFMFLRRPEEVLCSLFNYSKEKNILIRGGLEPNNLQEMFELSLLDEKFAKLWMAPDYIDELDYVAEFNDSNFSDFLLKNFGEVYETRKPSNTSKNKGFKYYRDNGEITNEIAEKFLEHPEYKKFLNYL